MLLLFRAEMAVTGPWNPEDTGNTTITHFWYAEAWMHRPNVFGFVQERPLFGSFMLPDAYMAVPQNSTFEYVRKPLPPPPPPATSEPDSSGGVSTTTIVVVVVVVGLAAVAAGVGVVVYAKMAKPKWQRSGSVTPTKILIDEDWSRVTPSPTQGAKRHDESIRHF